MNTTLGTNTAHLAKTDLAALAERPRLRHPGRWMLGLSLLVHLITLASLPWNRLFEDEPNTDRWLQIDIVTPPPPARQPAPEPTTQTDVTTSDEHPQPVATPAEPPLPTSNSEPVTEPVMPKTRAQPPDIVTSSPAESSQETWQWREKLLRQGLLHQGLLNQGQTLAPKKTTATDPAQRGSVPRNWSDPLLPDTRSWLDPYAIPGELQQESWTEADGTLRMEVTLPNGQRVCGRAAPPDPLQPLSYSIPLWRTCGTQRRALNSEPSGGNPLRRPPPRARHNRLPGDDHQPPARRQEY